MESADIFLERPLDLQLHRTHVVEAMLDSGENERERAPAMWQHNVQFWKFVQRSGCDELRRCRGMFKSKAKPVRQAGRTGEPFAINIRLTIERVEQERI